jgi:hypothetical protein
MVATRMSIIGRAADSARRLWAVVPPLPPPLPHRVARSRRTTRWKPKPKTRTTMWRMHCRPFDERSACRPSHALPQDCEKLHKIETHECQNLEAKTSAERSARISRISLQTKWKTKCIRSKSDSMNRIDAENRLITYQTPTASRYSHSAFSQSPTETWCVAPCSAWSDQYPCKSARAARASSTRPRTF